MEGGVPLPPIPKQTEKFPESQFNDWGFAKLPLLGPISELSSIYPDILFYLRPTWTFGLGFFGVLKKVIISFWRNCKILTPLCSPIYKSSILRKCIRAI